MSMSTVRIEDEVVLRAPSTELSLPTLGHTYDTARLVRSAGRFVVILLAVFVPAAVQQPLTAGDVFAMLPVAALWLVLLRVAFAAGEGVLGIWPSAVLGTLGGLVSGIALEPIVPGAQGTASELAVVSGGVLISAAAWEWVLQRTGGLRKRTLVVGTDELSTMLADELDHATGNGFELVARIGGSEAEPAGRVPCAGGLTELASIVQEQRPDVIVLTDERTFGDALDRLLDGPETNARVVGLTGFFEHALGRVPVGQLTPAWFMSLVHLRQPIYGRWTKRAFDVVAATFGLLLATPLMAVIALVVARSHGPLLFRQTRIGEGGRPFTVFKFRTMGIDAENGQARFTCENDSRVIWGGRLLRRTHLDELPQLWNVLRGDMSVVGPRPERPEFTGQLEQAVPFWNRRLLVKPGVTGWAQVQCGYVADCEEMADKLSYDLWYLRHRSLALDVAICLKTVALQFRALLPGAASSARGIGR
jgi:exopolysaccharide biosynthesis polyprenyl glycosylphosphotransferase